MYRALTRDIEVTVEPYYLADQSDPDDSRYVWGYRVVISNHSDVAVRLMTLGDGLERGIRMLEFRTGTGLRFTVLVDRQTGDAENILQVAPTGIEDQEALKQSLLVAYVSDREGYFLAGIQARLESVQRRSTGSAEESLRLLWSKGGGNTAYPPDVYGPSAEVTVTVRRITFLSPNVAQIRFLKTLRKTKQEPVTQPFVATVEFAFEPKTERSLAHVWENPLGFTVSAYRVDAETLETNP